MINVERVVTERFPLFFESKPAIVTTPIVKLLRLLFHERETNRFLEENRGIQGIDFIEKVLEYFDIDYTVSNNDLENIPATGRVVIVANHPLGALDALSLIQMVSKVRRDIKVVANDMLASLPPLQEIILPVDNLDGKSSKASIRNILNALNDDCALIVFPAGEVSRLRPNGVRDCHWNKGFLQFSKRTDSPILPIFINARNSAWFYTVSMVFKPLSALMLVGEMFKQKSNVFGFQVGELIPAKHLHQKGIKSKTQAKLLRKHLYRIATKRPGLFKTEKSIAHPESRQELKRELAQGQHLGATKDGKQIIMINWSPESSVMREIGRLREYSFRRVGEGTGSRRDTDHFDQYYRHLVLWDDELLEIVGAYRVGEGKKIRDNTGNHAFYSSTLFDFNPALEKYLDQSLELGRSFVQPKFWGSRALDYLWQGLGAYLRHHPEIRYLFGPVSISANYPREAKNLLTHYYSTFYPDHECCAKAQNPYQLNLKEQLQCKRMFSGSDQETNWNELKGQLAQHGFTIPTLYKQYTDLCEPGGIRFIDFNIDPNFSDCVDALILVDLDKIKPSKRKRYIGI